jgi:CRISPR-associated protein Cas1
MTLYLSEPGATLHLRAGRLRVIKRHEVLQDAPSQSVDEVILLSGTQSTSQAMRELLARGARLHLLAQSGRYLGRLEPPAQGGLELLRAQIIRAEDPAFCLELARRLVGAKLHNTRAVLLRLARNKGQNRAALAAEFLQQLVDKVNAAKTLEELRGLEGIAAQSYFAALAALLPPVWGFAGRRYRPPTDPVNALLSFAYSLVLTRVTSALQVLGMHPGLGFFHVVRGARPALALDLMEEYRAALADRLVLSIIAKKLIGPEQFRVTGRQVLLDRAARRRLLQLFEARLDERVALNGQSHAYRELFSHQARAFAAELRGAAPYRPLRIR